MISIRTNSRTNQLPEPIEIPDTGDPKVDAALARVRNRFSELEDAVIVQAFLEKKAGERLRVHAEWLSRHEQFIRFIDDHQRRHEEWKRTFETKMIEIEDKLNLLIGPRCNDCPHRVTNCD